MLGGIWFLCLACVLTGVERNGSTVTATTTSTESTMTSDTTESSGSSTANTDSNTASTDSTVTDSNTASTDSNTASTDSNTASTDSNTGSTDSNTANTDSNTASTDSTVTDNNTGSTDSTVTSDNTAITDSNTGSTDSNTASTDSNTGSTDSNTGSTDSNTASTDSNTASTDSNTASTDSNTASTDNNTGSTDSNTASTDSNTASTDSNTASTDSNTGSTDSNTGSTDSNTASTDSNTGSTDSNTGSTDSTFTSDNTRSTDSTVTDDMTGITDSTVTTDNTGSTDIIVTDVSSGRTDSTISGGIVTISPVVTTPIAVKPPVAGKNTTFQMALKLQVPNSDVAAFIANFSSFWKAKLEAPYQGIAEFNGLVLKPRTGVLGESGTTEVELVAEFNASLVDSSDNAKLDTLTASVMNATEQLNNTLESSNEFPFTLSQSPDFEAFRASLADLCSASGQAVCEVQYRCFNNSCIFKCRDFSCGGRGSCSVDSNSGVAQCTCVPDDVYDYSGDHCENQALRSRWVGAIAGGLAGLLLLVAAVVVVVVLWRRWRNKAYDYDWDKSSQESYMMSGIPTRFSPGYNPGFQTGDLDKFDSSPEYWDKFYNTRVPSETFEIKRPGISSQPISVP